MKIKELLSDESKWTQGCMARDEQDVLVPVFSDNAVCWCLGGAVVKCYFTHERDRIGERLRKALPSPFAGITQFNDNEQTTFHDIKTLLELADV